MRKSRLVLLFMALLLVMGCGKSKEEKAVEKQIKEETNSDAQVKMSQNGMNITGKTEDGKFSVTTGDMVKIPKDFPEDVFIYHPSKAVVAVKTENGFSIVLNTSDSKEKVLNSYRRQMKSKGWTEKALMDMGPQSLLVFEKGGLVTNVSVGNTGQGIQISVTVVKQ